jgi:hypothetical protein
MNSEEPSDNQDWWDNLTENQQQHINEGLSHAEIDRVVSSKEFWDLLKNS